MVLTLLSALSCACADPGAHETPSSNVISRELIDHSFGPFALDPFFNTPSEALYDTWARQPSSGKLEGSVSGFLDWNDVSTIFAIYNTWHLPVQGNDPRVRHIEENLIETTFGDRFEGNNPGAAYILLFQYKVADRKTLLSFKDGVFLVQDGTGIGVVDIAGPGPRENDSSGTLLQEGKPRDTDTNTKDLLSNHLSNARAIEHRNGFKALHWLFSQSDDDLHYFWTREEDGSKLEGPVSEFLDWHDVSSISVLHNDWHLLGGPRDMRVRHIEENLIEATFGDGISTGRNRRLVGYVLLLHYRDSERKVLLWYGDNLFIVEDQTGIGVVDIYRG